MTSSPRTAVLFRTHFWDDFARRQFDRLLAHAEGTDVFVLVDETNGPVAGIEHDRVLRVTEAGLLQMGFARAGEGSLLWFNGDYPLYRFLQLYPDYDYVLQLEYDVQVGRPLIELVQRASAERVDYVGLTKGEPVPEWFWLDSMVQAYAASDVRHQLICLSLFSAAALHHLWQVRLEHAAAWRAGTLTAWPFCEGFIPTQLAAGGFACRELSDFGSTNAYDHWPPFLEGDKDSVAGEDFVHPVLDEKRFVASMHKYHVGLGGFLNPASQFHRKLRRLPPRRYASVLLSSFVQKARRTLSDAARAVRPGARQAFTAGKG